MLTNYILPEGNVQISFSGGRTSGFMLHQILEANGGLPDRAKVVFSNTGREMPQTLDFVQECSDRWGVRIDWVEYRPTNPLYEVVSHNQASREGEPFAALLQRKKYLPNQAQRFCTIELKILAAKRFLVSLGWKRWVNIVGIRSDEAHRVKQPTNEPRYTKAFPLFEDGITTKEITGFWDSQPFDLRLPNVNGKAAMGNCDGCFLKSEAFLAGFSREHPERAAWWEEQENIVQSLTRSKATTNARFRKQFSREDLRRTVEKQGDWIFNDKEYLCQADHGECTG
jgi:3'-phosphoadenosine 5'-phosphosulfate sulfotransferase (PAPS reductase)/FAD synthetase